MRFVLRKELPHEIPSWVKTGALYFFTLCARPPGTNTLTPPSVARTLLDAVAHYHRHHRWHARLFLVMPDHVHALISFPQAEVIPRCWQDWKRYTAKTTGVDWQRDFFEHRIRDDENWELKARYIRENPVRKGLVATAAEWPWVFAGE